MTFDPALEAASSAEEPAVSVVDLEIVMQRTGHSVVSGVNLSIRRGEVLGIVGESGSGKSTLGRALLGHARRGLRIAHGQVLIEGTNMLNLDRGALRDARGRLVSFVPQDPGTALNPARRIGAQLRESLRVHERALTSAASNQRISDMLQAVRLPTTRSFLRSFPHQLSGGQQQRVCIAMAFMCRPHLVVLDEPTTGLDVTTQRHILHTVRQLAVTYGSSAVYISHDLPVVGEIADWIAVVYGGQVVEYGLAGTILRSASHQYTHRLLQAIPSTRTANVLTGIEGVPPAPGKRPAGCVFADRCQRVEADCRAADLALSPIDGSHLVRCIHPVSPRGDGPIQTAKTRLMPGEGSGMTVRGLTASFGSKSVLRDVDLDVKIGECIGIVGESGSGKTTLARCLVGLHRGFEADISLFDAVLPSDWRRRSSNQRRQLQYVFQNPYASLNPRMTVASNVAEPLRVFTSKSRSGRLEAALDALDRVSLGREFADRMPDSLSGGERQRAAIARAIVVQPDVLICDEVTSALDVSVQALVVEQLRAMQRDGLTLLFITHNLAVVRSIAQRVVVLEHGRVVESGAMDEVLDAPQHPYTRQLLTDVIDA